MSKRAKKSRDSGSSTKRSRSKGPSGGVKAMDYAYAAPSRASVRSGPEKKAVDDANAVYNFDTTGTLGHIGGVKPGAGRWERVGRKINYRSVHIKGIITMTNSAPGVKLNSMNRLVLVYDRQPNGNVPAISDILQDVSSAGTLASNAYSGLNLDNSQRFLILRDSRINLPDQTDARLTAVSSTNQEDSADINWFVKLRDLPCEYKGDTAGIASISSGALYLFTISDETTQVWGFRGSVRTRYVDY